MVATPRRQPVPTRLGRILSPRRRPGRPAPPPQWQPLLALLLLVLLAAAPAAAAEPPARATAPQVAAPQATAPQATASQTSLPDRDGAAQLGPRASFYDRMDVRRVALDVRVIDGLGNPVGNLGPESFRVRIDGAPARVESVDWIASDSPPGDPAATAAGGMASDLAAALAPPEEPYRIVFFFQAGMEPSHTIGLLRTLQSLRRMMHALPQGAVAAVVSYDSHFELHQDFTDDPELLVAAAERAVTFADATWPRAPAEGPSLARWLDEEQALATADVERALEIVGLALNAERGPSTVVFVGWGTGGRRAEPYRPARAALLGAGTPVLVLDVTDAPFHTSIADLSRLANETGGTYRSTYELPRREVARIGRMLGGHYLLVVERPPLPERARYPLRVELTGTEAWGVLAPEWIVLTPPRDAPSGEGSALR